MAWYDRFRPAPDPKVVQAAVRDAVSNVVQLNVPPRLSNPTTGMGGKTDKMHDVRIFNPYLSREQLERLYLASWAARKVVDIPVDDMWASGRLFTGDNESAIDAMNMAEDSLCAHEALANTMRLGRLFGTGLLIIGEKDRALEEPLGGGMQEGGQTIGNPDGIQPDGVGNFWVTDRFATVIKSWVLDPRMRGYGQPYMYEVTPRITPASRGEDDTMVSPSPEIPAGTAIPVHASRVIRFDGRAPLASDGWQTAGSLRTTQDSITTYDRDWGVSELASVVSEVIRDESTHHGIGHLVQVASILFYKVQGFKEYVKGRTPPGEPTIDDIAHSAEELASIYKMFFIDAEDEAERISVQFGGIPQIMVQLAQRLAAAAGIPATRFLAESPAGMNSTGESDARNYALSVEALRRKTLDKPLKLLDQVLARHAGLNEPPDWEWIPVLEVSDEDKMLAAKTGAEAILAAAQQGVIDENEARERLSTIELFGELPELTDTELEDLRMIGMPPEPPGGPPSEGAPSGGGGGGSNAG